MRKLFPLSGQVWYNYGMSEYGMSEKDTSCATCGGKKTDHPYGESRGVCKLYKSKEPSLRSDPPIVVEITHYSGGTGDPQ